MTTKTPNPTSAIAKGASVMSLFSDQDQLF
jgi:hypothetical protein